jgi:hypothetical protein
VTRDLLDTLIAYADFEVRAGAGCTVLRCSREGLRDREVRRSLGSKADRLASLAAIIDEHSGEIVTVLHDYGRPCDRRYRREI